AYFVPAFNGLGTPYWDAYARGTIVGLTRATNKNHIVRAVLESIAYQSYDVLEAICAESGTRPKMLKVDGGACANDFLMQFQADIAQLPIVRPACIETTALGAAYLAGLAVGYWNEKGEIAAGLKEAKIFVPQMDAGHRDELVADWHRAAERSLGWANT
ncbi:MAG: FGGY-family carbohydrate kinase, partial [Oscillospiraceae bacterium]|nr:FGGY-family carbohydrate kinase [Oscillospiraceae bacterium]